VLVRRPNLDGGKSKMPLLKKLFWLYFLLLIFEGALRKWFLQPLAAPLLLVRDPVALLIVLEAFRTNKWPARWSTITGVLAVMMVSLCVAQMVMMDNPWVAALYGLRSYLLPFPVAFIMGENLDREDLRKLGVFTLWILLPMTLLEAIQYRSSPDAFVNNGAYEGARQIFYVGVHVRASGTFSFVTGSTCFGPFVAAFLFYGLAVEKFAKKWLLWAGLAALVLSIPVVGSRAMVLCIGAVVACAAVAAMFGVAQSIKAVKVLAPLAAVFVLVSFLPIFSQATASLKQRSGASYAAEGGVRQSIESRIFGAMFAGLGEIDLIKPPLGIGMGQGANAIAKLLTGKVQFVAGEGEFDRVVTEMGPYIGIAFMLFRCFLIFWILRQALARAAEHDPLALLLFPMVFLTMFTGVLEQPTDQGFMVTSLGFSLAAIRPSKIAVVPAHKRGAGAVSRGPMVPNKRTQPRFRRGSAGQL